MKYEIKSIWDGKILYADEAVSFAALVQAAVKSRADLSRADLSRAKLYGANLYGANLSGANLSGANLSTADLSRADLYGYHSFGPGGSRNSYTWAQWEEGGYMVHCGCKTVTLREFAALVKATHKNTYYAKWYEANIKVMELVAENSKADYDKAATEPR